MKFFPSLTFTEDLVWSAFYSKTRVFPTFLKRGWLEIAHIRSTCGPDLPRARHALRFDGQFRQRVASEKSTVCVWSYVIGITSIKTHFYFLIRISLSFDLTCEIQVAILPSHPVFILLPPSRCCFVSSPVCSGLRHRMESVRCAMRSPPPSAIATYAAAG